MDGTEQTQSNADSAPEGRPKWADLFGIDPDFTGDLTTEEFLKESRGEA